MERPVKLIFPNGVLSVTDVTGRLPKDCRFPIHYAGAELYRLTEGCLLVQYHSNYLFYLELLEYRLHAELQAGYRLSDTSMFLVCMLDGGIRFYTSAGMPIHEAAKGTTYCTYSQAGDYGYKLSPGVHRLFYIVLRTDWLKLHQKEYPELSGLLANMETGQNLYGHMPGCLIQGKFSQVLIQLYTINADKVGNMEIALFEKCTELLAQYHRMVVVKFGQPIYQVRDFIANNYTDSSLSNQTLSLRFNLTEKTLTGHFRAEFNTTPHAYLIRLRMQKALELLHEKRLPINKLYSDVGYNDLRSFRIQFRKFYGYPPSKIGQT